MQQQLIANKRLDFEIARLKNCGELLKAGISFHPKSPYYAICADVVVQNVTTIPQHKHKYSIFFFKGRTGPQLLSRYRFADAALLGVPMSGDLLSPIRTGPSSSLSSQPVSPLLTKDQKEVLRAVPKTLPQQQ